MQAGENCQAYSNPRYGVPNDVNGNKVENYSHTHKDGDQCNVQIYFDQLYGGGQGVYGQPEHEGVNTDVKYLITFMHDDHVAGVQFVSDNTTTHKVVFPDLTKLPHLPQDKAYEWIDYIGNVVKETDNTTIPAGNQRDVFYYLTEANKQYVHFVDKDGFYVAQIEFNKKTGALIGGVVPEVPAVPGYYGVWEQGFNVGDTSNEVFLKGKEHDVIINAVYSKSENQHVLTSADDLFRFLEQGKQISMSQDLSGGFSNAKDNIFCDIGVNGTTEARFDLNSFTLEYNGASSANKAWTLFQIRTGSKLTVGAGLAGFGFLYFDLSKLNSNAKPCIFDLQSGATLVLERGVVIEFRYPKNNSNTIAPFNGVSNISQYTGITSELINGTEENIYRITVTARTVLKGE